MTDLDQVRAQLDRLATRLDGTPTLPPGLPEASGYAFHDRHGGTVRLLAYWRDL